MQTGPPSDDQPDRVDGNGVDENRVHGVRVDGGAGLRGVVVGRVVRLARYPLRSAGGEAPSRVRCTAAGLEGDRTRVLVDAQGRALRARDVPALAGLSAALVDGALEVRDGRGRVLDDAALADETGVPGARSAPADAYGAAPGGDAVAPLHVVSEGAESGPGGQECDPDPRANVVLALAPGQAPGAERGWVDAELAVGDALLRVARTPRRCLGVYADVLEPGEVAVGDEVRLLPGG